MTRTFVLHLVEVFFATLNAQATRLSIMQYYTANALALSGGFRGLWFLSSVPRVAALRHMVCLALEAYLPHLVSHIAKSVHVYSGSAIKHDGNYDMAALLTVVTRNRQTGKYTQTHPYTVLHGFVGIDGALLAPVAPRRTEDWPDIESELSDLTTSMMKNRAEAGLSLQAIPPGSHSTDTYGKHRLKLRAFYDRQFQACRARVEAATPKADAAELQIPPASSCPSLTEITGEPMHDHFAFRRCVAPAANDCRTIIADHKDMITRLSAPLAPDIVRSNHDIACDLNPAAEFLLKAAVERSRDDVIAQ